MDDYTLKHIFSRIETHIIDDRDLLNTLQEFLKSEADPLIIKYVISAIDYLRESQRLNTNARSALGVAFNTELKICKKEKLPSYEEFEESKNQ